MELPKERIILGIDPGTAVMGYGLVKETGPKIELIALGVVKMEKLEHLILARLVPLGLRRALDLRLLLRRLGGSFLGGFRHGTLSQTGSERL